MQIVFHILLFWLIKKKWLCPQIFITILFIRKNIYITYIIVQCVAEFTAVSRPTTPPRNSQGFNSTARLQFSFNKAEQCVVTQGQRLEQNSKKKPNYSFPLVSSNNTFQKGQNTLKAEGIKLLLN